ncbi:MAG TPA: inosine/xanthosine triphosphatase [Limnochordales bacterium]
MSFVRETVIAVGSTNPAKVGAVQAIAQRAFPGARVVPLAVASGVAGQPLSAAETAAGARTRALAALKAVPEAAYGIGLEGGLEPTPGGGDVVNCCAVAARDGRVSVAWGVRFPLPPAVVRRLLAGEELGPVIDEISGVAAGKGLLGAVGVLTGGLVTREAMWEQAVACALIPHLHPELYPLDSAPVDPVQPADAPQPAEGGAAPSGGP